MSCGQNCALPAVIGATMSLMLAGCAPLPFGSRPEPVPTAASVASVPRPPSWEAPVAAASTASDDDGVQRLMRLAEVWNAVRWFHPDVVRNAGAWDTAYLRHVDRARAARDDAAFAQAVHTMLGELGDFATRVSVSPAPNTPQARYGMPAAMVTRTGDSLLVARPVLHDNAPSAAQRLGSALGSAFTFWLPRTVAVVDLRDVAGREADVPWFSRALSDSEYPLPDGYLEAPFRRSLRRTVERGPPFERTDAIEVTLRDCCTEWTQRSGERLRPARDMLPGVAADGDTVLTRPRAVTRDGHRVPALVAIVNDSTVIPAPMFALHAQGDLVFVSTGTGALHNDAAAVRIPLGGGFHARVRTEELLHSNGTAIAVRADTVVSNAADVLVLRPDTTDAAVSLALAIARGDVRVAASSPGELASSRMNVVESLTMPATVPPAYPSHPERLLAVTRLWGIVRAFNPYLPMTDESWDEIFRRAITEAESAGDARAYASMLYRMVASMDASQADIAGPEHPEFARRMGFAPLRLRLVERRAIITQIDDSASARTGVRVGDEVLAIGGEPIEKRFGRLREFVSASNEWSRDELLAKWLERGPAPQRATFRMRSASGAITESEFEYVAPAQESPRRTASITRTIDVLANGVTRIALRSARAIGPDGRSTLAPLPDGLLQAPAIIIDARGATDDLALDWLSGSPLDANAQAYARDERSVLVAPPSVALRTPELDPSREYTRSERVAPALAGEPYTGPVAVLVDATTSGDAELLVLRILQGGTRRVLVGSPTAGSVGGTAVIALAGDVRVKFPVGDVRHTDGRFIQRLGLAPNITATPTVQSVRNGGDVVLETAQRWITQQLAPPAPVRRR